MPIRYRQSFTTVSGLIVGLFVLASSLLPSATARAENEATNLIQDHIVVEGHLTGISAFELGGLLAANSSTGLGFFAASMPGSNAYDGGWAILNLNQLNAGPTTAVKHFQFEPVYYRAGGISSNGHFAALRNDARIWADGNRNDIVVYDVSNPTAPTLYGAFRLEKTTDIWRITISDMVVYGNRAYLLASLLYTVPNQDFKGIIVVDLDSPDPTTKILPEISRYPSPINSMKLGEKGKLYGEDSDSNIYGYDLTPELSLLGIYAGGSKFDLDAAYGANAVIGRNQGMPTHVDFSIGPFNKPTVTTLQGESFVTKGAIGDRLLTNGRGHDLAVVLPEIVDAEGYAITVGTVDVSPVQASSLTVDDLAGGSFLFRIGSSELYKLRHDGWKPHLRFAANSPGILVNGQPINPGAQIAIKPGDGVTCSGQALAIHSSRAPIWPVVQQAETVLTPTCTMAVLALCTDYTVYNNLMLLSSYQAESHCEYIAETVGGSGWSLEKCKDEYTIDLLVAYSAALGSLCSKVWKSVPTATGSMEASAISGAGRAIVLHLTEGPLRVMTQDEDFAYVVESPLASAELLGRGSMEVLHDTTANATVIRAVDVPVIVRPGNQALAELTLRPGQIVGVTNKRVLPVKYAGTDVYVPFLMR